MIPGDDLVRVKSPRERAWCQSASGSATGGAKGVCANNVYSTVVGRDGELHNAKEVKFM